MFFPPSCFFLRGMLFCVAVALLLGGDRTCGLEAVNEGPRLRSIASGETKGDSQFGTGFLCSLSELM